MATGCLQGMLSSMSNGVITVDEDGKIATCNPAGLNILKIGKFYSTDLKNIIEQSNQMKRKKFSID